jgi:hypothetical protein
LNSTGKSYPKYTGPKSCDSKELLAWLDGHKHRYKQKSSYTLVLDYATFYLLYVHESDAVRNIVAVAQ